VIILAGANDLGMSVAPEKICDSLTELYQLVMEHNNHQCSCCAITIPENKFAVNQYAIESRTQVNQFIQNYCSNSNSNSESEQSQSQMLFCDLYSQIGYHNLDKSERKKQWESDGLHFTKYGYMRMGEYIFKCVRPWIQQQYTLSDL
jgi:lysophospholipase L1-like esterase